MDEKEQIEPSLDALSQAFAEAMGRSLPSTAGEQSEPQASQPPRPNSSRRANPVVDHEQVCPISPASVLEAILFVGHPNNEPIAAKKITGMLRGVDAEELEDLVESLNQDYAAQDVPFVIRAVGEGYTMELCSEFEHVQDRFYGRVRHAKLSQLAVDVLAIVAYNQPVTREEVDKMLNHTQPAGRVLNQLVRRDLLARRRSTEQPKRKEYVTTDRFLDVFQLSRLSDLPRSEEPS